VSCLLQMQNSKIIFTLFFTFCFTTVLRSQEIITASGGFDNANNFNISWTVGEPVSETVSTGDNTLTQGFQQSKIIITTKIINPEINFRIHSYPNPSNECIVLYVEKTSGLSYKLYDLYGKLMFHNNIENSYSKIFLNELPSAIYFLKVADKNKEYMSFKIIKM